MATGVAIMQPVMPTMVRQWVPQRIALGTAVYTNGLLVGEIIPVVLTLPFVLPWLQGSWRGSLVFWSAPIVIIALVMLVAAPRAAAVEACTRGSLPAQWVPDWKSGLVWRLGGLFLSINAIYFCANAFLPIFLTSRGRPDLIGGALTGLNFGRCPHRCCCCWWQGRSSVVRGSTSRPASCRWWHLPALLHGSGRPRGSGRGCWALPMRAR